ncbi:hypothetical protein WDW89_02360 [Deltaproteobacteria bacterium TL4]
MKILIIYYIREKNIRNTIDEHLFSFARYSGEDCYYVNASLSLPPFVEKIHFDLVIYHYTFLAMKWNSDEFLQIQKECRRLKKVHGYKVAIHQDEYMNSNYINFFLKEFGVKTIFTCLPESEYQKVYPQKESGLEQYVTVTTGYIDEDALKELQSQVKNTPHHQRDIDIGYRARKIPYWLGHHGQYKHLLAEKVCNAAEGSGLKMDISCDPADVFTGKDWYNFLLRCRVVLGCEGGASMHDPDGAIRRRVDAYTQQYPDANFEEAEKQCFEGQDNNLKLFAISPRHYECCITKTCQALVEGEYDGIFKAGVHYIEIKKDWSNLEEVIKKIKDVEFCEKIAEVAYQDIVLSGRYTYRKFVEKVLNSVRDQCFEPAKKQPMDSFYLLWVQEYNRMFPYRMHVFMQYKKVRGYAGRVKRLLRGQ